MPEPPAVLSPFTNEQLGATLGRCYPVGAWISDSPVLGVESAFGNVRELGARVELESPTFGVEDRIAESVFDPYLFALIAVETQVKLFDCGAGLLKVKGHARTAPIARTCWHQCGSYTSSRWLAKPCGLR